MQHLRCFHAYKQSTLHGEVCSWLLLAELTAALPQSTCGGLHHSEKHCSCLQIISPSAALQPGRFIYNKNQLLKASLPPHFYRTVIPIPGSGALLQACNKQQERRRRSPARWAQNTLCQHPKEALTLLSVPAGAAHSILLPAIPLLIIFTDNNNIILKQIFKNERKMGCQEKKTKLKPLYPKEEVLN